MIKSMLVCACGVCLGIGFFLGSYVECERMQQFVGKSIYVGKIVMPDERIEMYDKYLKHEHGVKILDILYDPDGNLVVARRTVPTGVLEDRIAAEYLNK